MQQELEKVTKILRENLSLKALNFPSKLEIFIKLLLLNVIAFNLLLLNKYYLIDSFEVNNKQIIKMGNQRKTVKFRHYTGKRKSPFMNYADLEVFYYQKVMESKI